MHRTIDFLLHHGYSVVIAWVFLEQAGLPMPSVPVLLAAGALAGTGHLRLVPLLICVVFPAVTADLIWYYLGRSQGAKILSLLCKISLEPDLCVRRTEGLYLKQGARSLLLAKFIPGLNSVASPLAGIVRMSLRRFLLFDALGAFFWANVFLGTGYVFSDEIERVAEQVAELGGRLVLLLAAGLAIYILYKYLARQRFLKQLRIARISVDELKQKLEHGENPVIVDLRDALDFEADPTTIPGALRINASELEQTNNQLPRGREVVLYCTCPNEATSVRVALLLKRNGIEKVRPLEGGLDAWRGRGYPINRAGS